MKEVNVGSVSDINQAPQRVPEFAQEPDAEPVADQEVPLGNGGAGAAAGAAAGGDGGVPAQSQAMSMTDEEAADLGRELGWDVVVHYPIEDEKEAPEDEKDGIAMRNGVRHNFVYRMRRLGLIIAQQKSSDQDTCLLKIAAPRHVLEQHAAHIGMEMKSIFVDKETGRHMYREFSLEHKDHFPGSGTRFFSSLERQRLIFSLIEEPIATGGAGMDLDKLVNQQKALKFVPLHEEAVQQRLGEKWLRIEASMAGLRGLFQAQPLNDLRDYFGEKIALYFAWLDWYTLFLKPLSFVGLLIFLVQAGYGLDYSNLATIFYSVVLAIWSTLFLESWKRREASLAFYWDVQDFEEEERVRPEFMGDSQPGIFTKTGGWVDLRYKIDEDGAPPESVPHNVYFSPLERLKRLASSVSVLLVFLFALIIGTFAILAFRVFVQSDNRAGAMAGGIIAGILNAFFINVMNIVYGRVSEIMNDWENHRTDTEYEDKLIAKQFSFKFVNSFSSLAFIAFAKDEPVPLWLEDLGSEDNWPEEFTSPSRVMGMDIGRCKGESCMSELFTQLMTLQITMIAISNFTEVLLPWAKKKVFVYLEERNAKKAKVARRGSRTKVQTRPNRASISSVATLSVDLPPFEAQIYAPPFGGVLEEYTELMIQFGYVTLFASAFPLSSFFALCNNLIEVKIDGYKLLFAVQRPQYMGAEDIGTWQAVLNFMSIMSVVSNCAIVCFTSGVFKGEIVDRESSSYYDCVGDCRDEYALASGVISSFNVSDWVSISNVNYDLKQLTSCLDSCTCESSLNTCYTLGTRLWIFVLSEHFLIGLKMLLAAMIPDKPTSVAQAEARVGVEKQLLDFDAHAHAHGKQLEEEWSSGEVVLDFWDNENPVGAGSQKA